MDDAAYFALPCKIGREIRIVAGFGAFVAFCVDLSAGGSFRRIDDLQKFLRIGGNGAPEALHHGRAGPPDEEAVVHAFGIDLKKQTGILCPPFHVLPDADPQAFFIGHRMVHPGIPVDPGNFQQITAAVQKGLEQILSQSFGRLIEIVYIIFLVFQKPFPVVVQSDTPEKIHGLGGITCKHRCFLFRF